MGISTHILDVARGRPAPGVEVVLEQRGASGEWSRIGQGQTDPDGRIRALIDAVPAAGDYRLAFEVSGYFERLGVASFYPRVAIEFRVANPAEHFHVPLLLSPFGYSTYRGS